MIVRQRKQMLTKQHIFGIGGGFVVLAGLVVAAQSSFKKVEFPLCDVRYPRGVLFSLSRPTGEPLSPEDLQSRLNGHDWGLLANTRMVEDSQVPKGYALEIDLKTSSGRSDDGQRKSGMGFTWLPRQLGSSTAACLSYSVWMSPQFKPGDGGSLPGLVSDLVEEPTAGVTKPDPETPVPFTTRMQWRADGKLMASLASSTGFRGPVPFDPTKAVALKPGQWMRIDQEIVLNTPGRNNGIMRVFIDGKLLLERRDLGYRKDESQSVMGVSGHVHYSRAGLLGSWAPAPADAKIRISPLELRYQ